MYPATGKPSRREKFIFWLILVSFSGNVYGVTDGMFSEDELKFFATLGLCEHFGGQCGLVCPHRVITHKWGVPLCHDDVLIPRQCCIGPAPTESPEDDHELTSSPSPTTTARETATNALAGSEEITEESCGQLKVPHARRKRIVGGQVAFPDTWPWLVAFRSMLGAHTCSGTVVDQRWVITAAHCFKYISNPSLWRVRIGEYNLLLQEVGERDVHIQKIIPYPGYSIQPQSSGTNETLGAKYVHDIALVRLSQDALTEPLCLPFPEDDSFLDSPEISNDSDGAPPSDISQANVRNELETSPRLDSNRRLTAFDGDVQKYNAIPLMGFGKQQEHTGLGSQLEEKDLMSRSRNCWVAGWGLTLDADMEDHVLREVSGDLVGSQECSQMWGHQLDKEMLCFGDGTYGPCAGDSGGPLSCEREGRFYLTGVVSWGTEECNVSGYPSVFTNLEPYLSWISDEMSRH